MVYFVLLMSKTNRSDKYKFAAHNEVKYLKRTANLFSIAIFFYLFGLISDRPKMESNVIAECVPKIRKRKNRN